jgi:hypothetical protein
MRAFLPLFLLICCSCQNNPAVTGMPMPSNRPEAMLPDTLIKNKAQVIHVFVALCDNKNQGIVPVPASIGNGQNPRDNLYWGCTYGVKTFFKKSKSWKLVSTTKNVADHILERCVFKHHTRNVYLVADAYDGAAIKQCTVDFLTAAAGGLNKPQQADTAVLGTGGSAQLLAYIGHDGLMDFSLAAYPEKQNEGKRETIILACISKRYFTEPIKRAGAYPLLWSTGLMSPEAYTLEVAIDGWLQKESPQQIRERAAQAYHRYQHCGVKAASRLLVSGW